MANALVVLTQNAWGAAPLWTRRRARLARSIADVEPDVVGLQEIHAPTTRGDESQAHELAAELGGYQVLFAPGRVTSSGACEGVALLVRAGLEIADHAAWKLSVDAGDALDAPHQRVVLRAMVRQRALVDVFVTHLSLSKRARERTIGELVIFAAEERRASRSAGAVLVGDLNAAPHEPALAQLDAAGWVDAWDRANPEGSGATWPAAVPFRRLDCKSSPWPVGRSLPGRIYRARERGTQLTSERTRSAPAQRRAVSGAMDHRSAPARRRDHRRAAMVGHVIDDGAFSVAMSRSGLSGLGPARAASICAAAMAAFTISSV